MSTKASRTEYTTRILLDLQELIEGGDKKGFNALLKEKKTGLHNATVGDAQLQEKFISVLNAALEKFIT